MALILFIEWKIFMYRLLLLKKGRIHIFHVRCSAVQNKEKVKLNHIVCITMETIQKIPHASITPIRNICILNAIIIFYLSFLENVLKIDATYFHCIYKNTFSECSKIEMLIVINFLKTECHRMCLALFM